MLVAGLKPPNQSPSAEVINKGVPELPLHAAVEMKNKIGAMLKNGFCNSHH